jgi:hypothetical protein
MNQGNPPSIIFKKKYVRLSGTPNFASINLHCGWENCFFKDDVEGLLYMLVHMLKGSLPWENLRTDDNYYT